MGSQRFAFVTLLSALFICQAGCSPDPQEDSSFESNNVITEYNTASTPIGVLLDDPAAKAVLDKYIPEMSKSKYSGLMRNSTLKGIQGYAAEVLTDEVLASIDAELAPLSPSAGAVMIDSGPQINVDESKVAPYTLPDPLIMANGESVNDPEIWWQQRRPEILEQFTTLVYGRVPPQATGGEVQIIDEGTAVFGGKAIRIQARVAMGRKPDAPSFLLVAYLPVSDSPVPVLLMPGFLPSSTFFGDNGIEDDGMVWNFMMQIRVPAKDLMPNIETFDTEWLIDAGFGVASFYYGDVDPDFQQGYELGVRGYYDTSAEKNPEPDAWGAISAWAWALSLAYDALANDSRVDPQRIALYGASRLGKTVLWAAARDQRFAAVIDCCSGKLGSGLMRRNFGETLQGSNAANSRHWVATNLTRYYGKEDQLPVDGHMLLSLIAPRPVLIQTGKLDHAADPKGAFLTALAAGPVYRLLGGRGLDKESWPPQEPILNDLGYYMHDAGHGVTPETWEVYLDFLREHLAN